jgi:hypothetical protein
MNKILQQALDEGWILTDRINKTYSVQEYIDKFGEKAALATAFAKQVAAVPQKSRATVRHPNKPKRKYHHRDERQMIIHPQLIPKTRKKEELFVPIRFDIINNKNFRINNRNKLALYLFLRATAVRKNPEKDANNLLQKLYNCYGVENKIVSAWSYDDLAEMFGYAKSSTTSIERWINDLWKEGAFEITFMETGKPEPLNVYIIGEWINGQQIYYYDLMNNGSNAITMTPKRCQV